MLFGRDSHWWAVELEYCLTISHCGKLQTFWSWPSSYCFCDIFLCLPTSWHIFAAPYSSRAHDTYGDVVEVAWVCKAVVLSKAVGPGWRHNEMRLKSVKLGDLWPLVVYVYFNGCTYMSQSLWCSATWWISRGAIDLSMLSACQLVCKGYPVVVRGFVLQKAPRGLRNFLINCVMYSVKTYSRMPKGTRQLSINSDANPETVAFYISGL